MSAGPPRPKGAPLSKQESEKLAGQIRPVWDTVPLASQPQKPAPASPSTPQKKAADASPASKEAPTISGVAQSPALSEGPTISAVSKSPALGEAPTMSAVSKSPALSEGPTISAISESPAIDEPPTITAMAESPAMSEGPTISVMSSVGPLIPMDEDEVLTSVSATFIPSDAVVPSPMQRPAAPEFAADKEDPTFVSAVMDVGNIEELPANVHDEPTVQVPPGQEAQFLAERERMLAGTAQPVAKPTGDDEPTVQPQAAPIAPLAPKVGPLAATPGGDRTQDIGENDFIDDPSVIKPPLPQGATMPRAQKTLVGLNDVPTRPTDFGVVSLEKISGGSNMTPHPPFELLEEPLPPNAPTVAGAVLVARRQNRVRSFVLGAAGAIVAIIGIGVVLKLIVGEPTGSTLPPPTATTKSAAAQPAAPEPEQAKADPAKAEPQAKADPTPADTTNNDPPAPAPTTTDSSTGWSGSPPAPIAATPTPIAATPPHPAPARPQSAPAQPRPAPRPPPAHPTGGGGGKTGKSTGIVRDTPF